MGVGPDEYRETLKNYASGVTIVTVSGPPPHGMTASSFASVSLDPPLVLVCLEKTARTHGMVIRSGSFAVNVLRGEYEEIARAFATPGDKSFDDRWDLTSSDGAPMMSTALARMECRVTEVVSAGDHDVVIAEVIEATNDIGSPLIYFNRSYHSLADNT